MSLLQVVRDARSLRSFSRQRAASSGMFSLVRRVISDAENQPVNVPTADQVAFVAQHLSSDAPAAQSERVQPLPNPFAAQEAILAQAEAFNRLGLFGGRYHGAF